MICMPNCAECSDIYVCKVCSSGTLVAGICITNTLDKTSGIAELDTFSFDPSEYATINNHINNQLGVSLNT